MTEHSPTSTEGGNPAFQWRVPVDSGRGELPQPDESNGQCDVPAPPIATDLGLRIVGGASDMLDERGALATIYREAPGPGYGCSFLYIRADLVAAYCEKRNLHLVQAVVGERTLNYRVTERGLRGSVRKLFQSGVHRFSGVTGLDGCPQNAHNPSAVTDTSGQLP